jgi:hypothetical protein
MTVHVGEMTSQVEGYTKQPSSAEPAGSKQPVDERRVQRAVKRLEAVQRRTRAEAYDD